VSTDFTTRAALNPLLISTSFNRFRQSATRELGSDRPNICSGIILPPIRVNRGLNWPLELPVRTAHFRAHSVSRAGDLQLSGYHGMSRIRQLVGIEQTRHG
jgi:hypothetical protein